MSLSSRFSKNLPVSGRKRIVEQDLSGPAEMNIFIKSRERCQLNFVVIPDHGVGVLFAGEGAHLELSNEECREKKDFSHPQACWICCFSFHSFISVTYDEQMNISFLNPDALYQGTCKRLF